MHFGAVKRAILNGRLMNSLSLPTSPGGERDMAPGESSFANRDRSSSLNSQIFGALMLFCWDVKSAEQGRHQSQTQIQSGDGRNVGELSGFVGMGSGMPRCS